MDETPTDRTIPTTAQTDDNRLGGFAARIGRALLLDPGADGAVVSIESPWGYGKTRVISQTQSFLESLPESERPVVINFNPWTIDPVMPFAPALFSRVSTVLGSIGQDADAVATLFGHYVKATVAHRERDVSAWWDKASESADLSPHGSAADVLSKLRDAMTALNRSIVVLVDDIDRLPPFHMYEMLRLAQALAYLPRVAILLAFDPVYVRKGLESQRISNADDYLERFLQVRVTLPQGSDEELGEMLEVQLQKFSSDTKQGGFDEDGSRLNQVLYTAVRFVLQSRREIKRVFERLRFSERAVRGEVVFADLLALESLAVAAPKVYEHIRTHPEAYVGVNFGENISEDRFDEMILALAPEREEALESVAPTFQPHVRHLIAELFPYTSDVGFRAPVSAFVAQGRIAAPACLQIALRYGMTQDVSTLPVVRDFVATNSNRKRILRDVLNASELSRFLSDLRATLTTQIADDPTDFLTVMAVLSSSPKAAKAIQSRGGRSGPRLSRQIWWIVESLFFQIEYSERLRCLNGLMSNNAALALSAEALIFCMRQHGVLDIREQTKAAARWCSREELSRLQALWVKTAAAVFASSAFAGLVDKKEIFSLLARIDPMQARAQIDALMQLEEDFDCLVYAFGEFRLGPDGTAMANIDTKLLDDLGQLEAVRERARQRVFAGPSLTPELAALFKCLEGSDSIGLGASQKRSSPVIHAD